MNLRVQVLHARDAKGRYRAVRRGGARRAVGHSVSRMGCVTRPQLPDEAIVAIARDVAVVRARGHVTGFDLF